MLLTVSDTFPSGNRVDTLPMVYLANVHLAAGMESCSMASDLNGFIVVLNTSGRIILLSDNVEDYLRKDLVRRQTSASISSSH